MKHVIIGILVLCTVAACIPAEKGAVKITEAEIREMLTLVEEASKSEDIKTIMSFMADEVEISLTARGTLGITKKTMGREDYERELRLGMSLTDDYEFRTNIRNITIAPDGLSAVVETDIYEVVEMLGVKATSITDETAFIQRRDGKLKFVKINAESEIQMAPAPGVESPEAPEAI